MDTARGNRGGLALVDCLLACLIVGSFGVTLLQLTRSNVSATGHLRTDLVVRQLLMDLLDRMAAGEARLMLSEAPARRWVFRRVLDAGQLDRAAATDGTPAIPGLEVTVELAVPSPPGPGERLRLGLISCGATYVDPMTGRKKLTLTTLTDAL